VPFYSKVIAANAVMSTVKRRRQRSPTRYSAMPSNIRVLLRWKISSAAERSADQLIMRPWDGNHGHCREPTQTARLDEMAM